MAGVRPFLEGDVDAVADLVWKVLHQRQGAAPPSIRIYFSELFLHNPWREEGTPSLVYDDAQGEIIGFFGVVSRRMSVQGKTVRLAFGSNFVMAPGSRASMAAIQLVRAFVKGPQDVSITDSANASSRQLMRSLGFQVAPIYSLVWVRPLRPSLYGFHGLTRLKKSRALTALGGILKPLCRLADFVANRVPISPFHLPRPQTVAQDIDAKDLLELLLKIPAKNWLLPEYDQTSLDWVLEFVETRKAFGDVRKVVVRDTNGKPLGWFIYYVARGGVGEVLQIGAESAHVAKVLDHLFHDALAQGLVGLHGRLEPQFMQELTMKLAFFVRAESWTLVHSDRLDLVNLIQSGQAFFSRLDGEWALRPGPKELADLVGGDAP